MTPLAEKRKSVSPIKKHQPLTVKPVVKKTPVNHKENNPNIVNQNTSFTKKMPRKSVSPLKINQGPTFKKVELRPSKSPRKAELKIHKDNTKNVKHL